MKSNAMAIVLLDFSSAFVQNFCFQYFGCIVFDVKAHYFIGIFRNKQV